MNSSARGFTLIELMLVVGIITILTGALIPGFVSYLDSQNLRQALQQVQSDLRTVQNRALTNTQIPTAPSPIKSWGLKFTAGQSRYIFFAADSETPACDSVSPNSTSSPLPEGVSIIVGSAIGNTSCVYFKMSNGNSNAPSGTPVYVYVKKGTTCSRVDVSQMGLISVSNTATCPY